MSYSAALNGLMSLAGELHTKRKFELGHMRMLMAALGDPQKRFRSVLIAGTNGKGSTAATLAAILHQAGIRTGLYTSPHLERVNERIRIAENEITDADFARLYFQVDDRARALVAEAQLPAMPSFFETVTALAFLAFAEASVKLAVLEVGLGGRLDATNIVEPLISVITDISLDHMEWLGSTIDAITREKAGILRKNGVMVTLPQHPEANQALGEVAVPLSVTGVDATAYIPSRGSSSSYELQVFGESVVIEPVLAGQHQQRNTALAIAAACELRNRFGYKIGAWQIQQGIRQVRWPGRLERMGDFLLDVAHNPAGAWTLRSYLSNSESHPAVLIFGCLGDKDLSALSQILFPVFDEVILVPVPSPRAASLEAMVAAAEKTGARVRAAIGLPEAVAMARSALGGGRLAVITGSVYLVGAARAVLHGC